MDARDYVKDTLLLLNELHAEGIIEKMTNRFANTYTQKKRWTYIVLGYVCISFASVTFGNVSIDGHRVGRSGL